MDSVSTLFKKRKGTTNRGSDYENLIIARLVLNLTLDDAVRDFKISSNDDSFGAFDDVVVEIDYQSGEVARHAIQAKYSNDKSLTKSSLTEGRGNFSIKKYLDNWKKLKHVDGFNFILFTNREFDISDKENTDCHGNTIKVEFDRNLTIDNYNVVIDKTSDFVGISQGRCFTFVPKENQTFEPFFQRFFLYTNQIDAEKLEAYIHRFFENLGSEASTEYIEFIRKWGQREGKKIKLNKVLTRRKLALILVSPHLVNHRFGDHTNCQAEVLKSFILEHRVVYFSEDAKLKVVNLWNKVSESDKINGLKLTHWYQLSHGNTCVLWLMGECPLIVTHGPASQKAIELCPDMPFIVLGQRPQKLSELDDVSEILTTFRCCLQGRDPIDLETLISAGRLSDVFTTDHLLEMVDGPKMIGTAEELPIIHISRSLSRNTLPWSVLDHIDFGLAGDSLVLITNYHQCPQMKYRTLDSDSHLEAEENEWEFCEGKVVLVCQNDYTIEEFEMICQLNGAKIRCHQFRVMGGELEWVRSKGGVTDLKPFLWVWDHATEEDLFKRESDNRIHIVCAGPGMGKTTLMKNIKNNSSTWTALICVRNHVGYFKTKSIFLARLLDDIDDELERRIAEILIEERRIKLLWDGLDEISEQNLEQVLDLIDSFAKMGITQWITSRDHVKDALEERFSVLSQTIREFDRDEQKHYIQRKLQCKDNELDDMFARIERNIQLFPRNDILGIPLQIYILTELLLQDNAKYVDLIDNNLFSLTDLYEHFVDEKFTIYLHEKEGVERRNDLLDARNHQFKLAQIDYYERAAMQSFGIRSSTKIAKDPVGLIVKTRPYMTEFIHASFAEYFTASFLSKNRQYVANFKDFLTNERYDNVRFVRFFFDLIMAKNCRPHIDVLYKSPRLLQKCTITEIIVKDGAERNTLQLASTWGHKHKIIHFVKSDAGHVTNQTHFRSERDTTEYCLAKGGAQINATNKYGEMAIHLACELGTYDIVKFLIDNGADVTAVTAYDETPLHMVQRRTDIAKMLRSTTNT